MQSKDGCGLKSEISFVVVGNLSHKSLEGELSDEQLSRLLELSDLSESHGSWSEPMRSLCSTKLGADLALRGFAGNVLSWCLGSGVLSSGMLCSGHN